MHAEELEQILPIYRKFYAAARKLASSKTDEFWYIRSCAMDSNGDFEVCIVLYDGSERIVLVDKDDLCRHMDYDGFELPINLEKG